MSYTAPKFIYFMKPVGMEGPIKIGCSSVPQKRLEELAVWSPFPLEVMAFAKGSYALEQKFHKRFAFAHAHREWFHPAQGLVDAIAKIARGTAAEDAADLSIETGKIRNGRGSRPEPEYRRGLRSYSARVRCAEKKLRAQNEYGAWMAPDEVHQILKRWNGFPYRNVDGVRPTEAELRKLERYLSDPANHSVVPSWRKEAA